MIDSNAHVGQSDIVLITLDTLRYDVAQSLFEQGRTPNLAQLLPPSGWEERHSPGSFTYAAHAAIFAGFFPTPATPGIHPRPFAVRFAGSQTIVPETAVFDAPDIVQGLAAHGYRTVCVGGVGFFNKQNPIGNALPGLFEFSHWDTRCGVTDPDSTQHQIEAAARILAQIPDSDRVFLFVNVSALHQPNRFYLPGCKEDSIDSHAAALEYVDTQIPALMGLLTRRAPVMGIVCADHGTAYGEDGYTGHRVGHPVVWTVPYAAFTLDPDPPAGDEP